jgi:hypothetical protein
MRRRLIPGAVGVALTVVSAAVVLVPGPVATFAPLDSVVGTLSGVGPTLLMSVGALLAGLYVAVVARSPAADVGSNPATATEHGFQRAVTHPPEEVTAGRRQVTAAGLEADVETAVEAGGEPLASVRGVLGRTAAAAYAEYADTERTRAREAVAGGAWTDDRTAAAFLADDRGPTPPAFARLRLWLTPAAERRRRIDRTLAAIARLGEGRE